MDNNSKEILVKEIVELLKDPLITIDGTGYDLWRSYLSDSQLGFDDSDGFVDILYDEFTEEKLIWIWEDNHKAQNENFVSINELEGNN